MNQNRGLGVILAYDMLLSFPFGEIKLWDVITALVMYVVVIFSPENIVGVS